MQILTRENVPAIDSAVTVTNYMGDIFTGKVSSRDWAFERLLFITVEVPTSNTWRKREVQIWADRDLFELV